MPADVSELLALAANLEKANGQVGREEAKVVRTTTTSIAEAARQNAPIRTGMLRASITSTIAGSGAHGSITGTVEATADYAPYVEFGTAKMAPEPFMTPALEANEGAFYSASQEAGASAVERAL